ncbi:MAG TPA: DUF433 domain-containing protein [Planctomycetota bacterium]|nr:DUF433 domain-containing protein [Planctomycetota bacterium]
MDWRARLSATEGVCHGHLCITGTRIPASVVLDNLAAGLGVADIVASYPSLSVEDVRAVLAWAAEIARERTYLPATRAR